MNPEVASYLQVAAITVGLVASLCAIGVMTVRVLIHSTREQPRVPSAPDGRMEQLQQSVDAIAVEVERIAEAQRFTTKLLSEREQTPPLRG